MISLFAGEKIITESNDKSVTLTSHRICLERRSMSRSYNQNIMLEHVTSTEIFRTNFVYLLVIGCICFALGLHFGTQEMAEATMGAAGVGLVFIAAYIYTKSNVIVIGSPSTKMQIYATGMKREMIVSFINKIEHTKHERILNLHRQLSVAD